MLGVRPGADAAEVRAAYRRKVKECHPDQFTDAQRQKQAQDELIRLNLAYEQALKLASQRRVGFNLIAQEEAKHFALRLMEQGNLESALRQLLRADTRDDGWYALQGKILMGLHRYDEAHQSYREAIKLDPDNREYRVSETVQVLLKDSAYEDKFYATTLSQINASDYQLTGWYDDYGGAGGQIRILVATPR